MGKERNGKGLARKGKGDTRPAPAETENRLHRNETCALPNHGHAYRIRPT